MEASPAERLARWQGGIDTWKEGVDSRFRRNEGKIETLDSRQDEFDRELSAMRVKVAVAAAIGSVVGGGIVTVIVAIGTKALGA